jgi:predicted Zn-dependent protease
MKRMRKTIVLLLPIFLWLSTAYAQKTAQVGKPNEENQKLELADEYFRRGDFEKAAENYEVLLKDANYLPKVHKKYVQALIALKKDKQLERYLEKTVKRNKGVPDYAIDLANFYKNQKDDVQSNKVFNALVKEIYTNETLTEKTANALLDAGQMDWAETLLTESRRAIGKPLAYVDLISAIYRAKGNITMLLDEILMYAGADKSNLYYVQQMLQQNLRTADDLKALERILISRMQGPANSPIYTDLLYWLSLQQKDFTAAFMQARAIDRRDKMQGAKIMEVGYVALQNKSYSEAATAFEYVAENYAESGNFFTAKKNALLARELTLKDEFPINKPGFVLLVSEFKKLIEQTNNKPQVHDAMRSVALIYSQYLNNTDSAEFWLNEVINHPRADRALADRCKIELADILLSKEIFWEATLLYSQVEKSQKETPLGHEAKLRNAKLSYYKGEFKLAVEHLDVLKIATTREISNDAMDLALMINDNTVFDTMGVALQAYSKAELLLIQNRQEQALAKLDSLEKAIVDKSLTDEIFWLRAKIYKSRKQWEPTLVNYKKLIESYSEGLYGDDALYFSALIQEEELGDKDKAMELYAEFLKKHPGSIYLVEVRKRFRKLRGDVVN